MDGLGEILEVQGADSRNHRERFSGLQRQPEVLHPFGTVVTSTRLQGCAYFLANHFPANQSETGEGKAVRISLERRLRRSSEEVSQGRTWSRARLSTLSIFSIRAMSGLSLTDVRRFWR